MQKPPFPRLPWLSALAAYLGLGVGSAYPSDDKDTGGVTPHSAQVPDHSNDSPAVDTGGTESSDPSASGPGEAGPGEAGPGEAGPGEAGAGASDGAGDSGGGDGAGD